MNGWVGNLMEPLRLMRPPAAILPQMTSSLLVSLYSKLARPNPLWFSLHSHTRFRPLCGAATTTAATAAKVSDAQLKDNWLASLSCPFPRTTDNFDGNTEPNPDDQTWVIGIDPDLSGALALLKGDDSAQVYDSPHLKVLVGKKVRRRLDAKSIVQLLASFNAPLGTVAYIEQSAPFPQDGKQGWWSGGFGYGLWIGILVALGFSVVPVSSLSWKNKFELAGSLSRKDDSRRVAAALFPPLSPMLERKKDHGRAEALLIAAYGKGMNIKSDLLPNPKVLVP